jgi:hypothetical protein
VVRQYPQSQHPARLRERDQGFHATVTWAHVIAWRDDLARRPGATRARRRDDPASPCGAVVTVRISLRENAVTHNPVKGVKRPKAESGEGKTPAIGDHQARELLAAPGDESIKEKRDRAILSTLLFHALRREELCKLANILNGCIERELSRLCAQVGLLPHFDGCRGFRLQMTAFKARASQAGQIGNVAFPRAP